jgi:predicted porin
MKKLTLAVSALALSAGPVYAQSTVTLYGVLAGNLTYTSNVQTAATSASGKPVGGSQIAELDSGASGPSASRWGLKGAEDLGGGLKAIFQLENGFNYNNGTFSQGGTEFGRLAIVGLTSQIGAVTLGRQYDTTVEFISPLSYAWSSSGGNLSIHPADFDNTNLTHRINNSVKYVTNAYSGVRFGAFYSFGGVAGSISQNQLWSTGFSYIGPSISFAASIVNARNPNISLYGTNANASTTGNNLGSPGSATSPAANPAIVGFASAHTQQTIAIISTYVLGSATVGLEYTNAQFKGFGSAASLNTQNYSGSTDLSTAGLSLRYQVTPSLRVGGAFDYTHGGSVSGKEGAKYEQISLGTDYSLSKATSFYLTGAYQHASGRDSLGRVAVADIGYLSPSATTKQIAVSAGIKHTF